MAAVITFEVGDTEKHTVMFSFDRFWGGLTITVDGNSVVNTTRLFSFSLIATWEFLVGVKEQHHVRIDKHRAIFFPGFRPQPVFAYVDGELVAQTVS